MRPLFADPKTDFVFKRIFGSEAHKGVLIAFLDAVLELDDEHRIDDVVLLDAEQRPEVRELKHSIVDVKCRDVRGTTYVVEMQVLNVEGFEKRVVYNVAKAYTSQLGVGAKYPALDDVVGVTICDFVLWDDVPMLSRWRMQEQHSGLPGLAQLQFVFMELPKYTAGERPTGIVDKWAYFFREAGNLDLVPDSLAAPPFSDALEAARAANFTEEEWDAYIRAGMALQDERGALSLAEKVGEARGEKRGEKRGEERGRREGRREGLTEGLQVMLLAQLEARFGALPEALVERIQAAESEQLTYWGKRMLVVSTLDELLGEPI
ncbi:Rpn family recombination-promoting nuclease/putative transposase [Haliangium sp.]|uniref:Rpn family recombination-promoting nuclease/putative transposase n=1 Tax=Haliangium sp. TaxID=2663208 RepID=UPI003D10A90F